MDDMNKEPLLGEVEPDISDSGGKVGEINKTIPAHSTLIQSLSAAS